MKAGAVYLADTSVFVLQARPQVRRRFADLLAQGRLAACQMTTLEYLNNAPDPSGYETLWRALHGCGGSMSVCRRWTGRSRRTAS